MAQPISIGNQDFESMRENHCFYVDKTCFIKEWWENHDVVTLITRPRRFGKTLNLNMMECFFSKKYENRGDLFEGLSIWEEEPYHQLQGSFPVICFSFASVKGTTYEAAREGVVQILTRLYGRFSFLRDMEFMSKQDREYYDSVGVGMSDTTAAFTLYSLSDYLSRYYGKKVLILLDEYDTPLQEAYVYGYWKELTEFMRSLFNATFKTNPYMERALMTGITRVSKESIFSDLNNLEIVTTTSEKYMDIFGFTAEEVQKALEQFGFSQSMEQVSAWYDGFCFGSRRDIYNPWSITKFLDSGRLDGYWANTSGNALVNKLIREANAEMKMDMEVLLNRGQIETTIDEEIVFSQLDENDTAIWSLLLASGYLRVEYAPQDRASGMYQLSLTNYEVRRMFCRMIQGWFSKSSVKYNEFVKALMANDLSYMNQFMNQMAMAVFSHFDTGRHPSRQSEPERLHSVKATTKGLTEPNPSVCFYHGFVLGLIADSRIDYVVTSNRESGFGRYDVVLEPRDHDREAFVLEFKVYNPDRESGLEDTVRAAHRQIQEKEYDRMLLERGIPRERIRHYGFAFEGNRVLIG